VSSQHAPLCQVPKPSVCGWCHGTGVEPEEESAEIPCLACNGFGIGVCEFVLPPTRTKKFRGVLYEPGTRRLTITQNKVTKCYLVTQRPVTKGWEHGLALEIVNENDGTVYDVFTGHPDLSCTCPGFTFEASKKANVRSLRRGDFEETDTWGCVHCDSLVELSRSGWLDFGSN
jgi:hypothetical protein